MESGITPEKPKEMLFQDIVALATESCEDLEGIEIALGDIESDVRAYVYVGLKDADSFPYEKKNFLLESASKRLKNVLNKNGMEMSARGGGSSSETYRIDRRFINGKINWRRWVSYPEKFSEKVSDLLDEASSFAEFQTELDALPANDDLECFDRYVRWVEFKGLITKEEAEAIKSEKWKVAH